MKQPDRPDEMPTFVDEHAPRGSTPLAGKRGFLSRFRGSVDRPRKVSGPSFRRSAPRLRSHLVYAVVVLLLVIAVPLGIVARLHDAPPPIRILVNDKPVLVSTKTTFGGLVRQQKLRAADGRLLDVEGSVLNPHADPGEITLNGDRVKRTVLLHAGDHIEVHDGKDKTEPTVTKRSMLPGRNPGNPQYTLRTGKVLQITTEGKVSGEILSTRYQAKGAFKTPPAVALTFDDGPWPGSSLRILSILEKMHVKATFFVIGNLAERYPDTVRREERAGMTVANHSWDHPNSPPFDTLPARRIDNEMSMTNVELRKLGIHTELFRPPGGSVDDRLVGIARQNGLRVVNWDVDPRDWAPDATPASITKAVLTGIQPGSIVDLHDGGGDQSATIKALPDIIRGIRKRHLQLVAL
jgi:peptidoglycan/xylan/chitin deacetylase (PgdA/CDA1 family)/sulfur carrier protein ThiS